MERRTWGQQPRPEPEERRWFVLGQNEEPGTCAYASCARSKGQQPEGPGTKSSRSSLVTLMHWEQLIDGASLNASRCRSRAETAMLRLPVLPVTIVAAKTRASAASASPPLFAATTSEALVMPHKRGGGVARRLLIYDTAAVMQGPRKEGVCSEPLRWAQTFTGA